MRTVSHTPETVDPQVTSISPHGIGLVIHAPVVHDGRVDSAADFALGDTDFAFALGAIHAEEAEREEAEDKTPDGVKARHERDAGRLQRARTDSTESAGGARRGHSHLSQKG